MLIGIYLLASVRFLRNMSGFTQVLSPFFVFVFAYTADNKEYSTLTISSSFLLFPISKVIISHFLLSIMLPEMLTDHSGLKVQNMVIKFMSDEVWAEYLLTLIVLSILICTSMASFKMYSFPNHLDSLLVTLIFLYAKHNSFIR